MSPATPGRVWAMLHRLEEGVAVFCFLLLLLFACIHIFLRLLSLPQPMWLAPLLPHLVVWIGMVGALVAVREDKHIVIDLGSLSTKASRWQAYINGWKYAVSFLVCLALAISGGRFVLDERLFGSVFYGAVPLWPFLSVFPVCFSLMSGRYLVRCCRAFTSLSAKR